MKYSIFLIVLLIINSALSQSGTGINKKDSIGSHSGDIKTQDNIGGVNVTGRVGGSIITNVTINYGNDTIALRALDSILAYTRKSYALTLKKEQDLLQKNQQGIDNWDSINYIHNELGLLLKQNGYLNHVIDSLRLLLGVNVNSNQIRLVKHTCPECHGTGTGKQFSECTTCHGMRLTQCTICDPWRNVICKNCNGSGKFNGLNSQILYCTNCNGHGSYTCKECNDSRYVNCSNCLGKGEVSEVVDCTLCKGEKNVWDTVGKTEIVDNFLQIFNSKNEPIKVILWYGYPSFSGQSYKVFESMRIQSISLTSGQSSTLHNLNIGALNIYVCYNSDKWGYADGSYFHTYFPGAYSSIHIQRGVNYLKF